MSQVTRLKYVLFLALLAVASVGWSQDDDTYDGGTMNELVISEDQARNLMRQLLDVDALLHSIGARTIANDDRLVAFVEGFMERNGIGVLTISYVDSEELWPKMLKKGSLKKIEKAPDNTLVAGILFFPERDAAGKLTGYTAKLVLEGKTNEVYELLKISGEDLQQISDETSTEQMGNTSYAKPKEAQSKVVDAMIAALQKVEQQADPEAQTGTLVTFSPDGQQDYGFDMQTYDQLKADYPTIVVGGQSYPTAWKSLKTTGSDQVIAVDSSGQEVSFELDGIPVTGALTDGKYSLSLQRSTEGEGELLAKVGETTVGKLNTVTYSISTIDLKVVPVNGAGSGITAVDLKQTLNEIYAPAVAEWNVEVLPNQNLGNAWDPEGDGLDDGETGSFTNYTDEMNDLIKEFKRQNDRDKDAYYIFLVDKAENASKLGYMPRKKQWGFVFIDSHNGDKEDIMTTVAHELGHGVYRLEHTFSEKGLPKGQTDNLMDYSSGKELYKYQWDYVHDPASVVTLFDDEEEASAFGQGPGGVCIGVESAINTLNQRFKHFYLPDGRILDTEGKYLVSGFFSFSNEEADSTRGTLFAIRNDGYDYQHVYATNPNNKTYGYGLRMTNDLANVITIENFKIINSSEEAVKVLVDKERKEIKAIRNGEQVGETISFQGPCNCADLNPSEDLYFAFDNQTSEYVKFARQQSKKVTHSFHEDEDLINTITSVVEQQMDATTKDESFLGEILADKLITYEEFNEKKFIVAPVAVNLLTVNQISWSHLAEVVFERAGLSPNDILITVPYVQVTGIGSDKGEYFFMPGLAYGSDVEIAVSELNTNSYQNTQRVANFISGELSPVENFIVDVFRHTSKKMLLYKAIFNASNTIELIEIRKDNVSGQIFNKTLQLYQQNAVDELEKIIASQKNEVERIEDDLDRYILDFQNNPLAKQVAQKAVDRQLKQLEVTQAEERIAFIEEHQDDKLISPYQANTYHLKIREKYLEQALEHERIKDLDLKHTFALAYIFTDAFNDARQKLDYTSEAMSSELWQDNWTFTDKTDYILKRYDQSVYNSLDGASVALGFFGLDIIADGIGFGYALYRGDAIQAGGYSVGMLAVGPESAAVVKASTSGALALLTKKTIQEGVVETGEEVGKKAVLEIAQNYADNGVISQQAVEGFRDLNELEIAGALKATLNGLGAWVDDLPDSYTALKGALSRSGFDNDLYRLFDAADPAEKILMADSWMRLKPNSFVRTDAARFEKFQKFNDSNQGIISQFTDADASSTLSKFLDDVDNPNSTLTTAFFNENPNSVNSWKLVSNAVPTSTGTTAFAKDITTLKRVSELSDANSAFRKKFPDTWENEISDLISRNSELRCIACGNMSSNNSLLSRLPSMDEMLQNINYLAEYRDIPGFDNAYTAFKSNANNRDGINHMVKYMRNNTDELGDNITAFEFKYIDDQLRRADLAAGDRLYEFKSWTKNADQPWNGFFSGSGNSYDQFLDYLRNTDDLDNLRYVFNSGKVTESEVKAAFKSLFASKENEIFEVLFNNSSLKKSLFGDLDKSLSKTMFQQMVNSSDNKLFKIIISQ